MNLLTPMKFAVQRALRSRGWEVRRFAQSEMQTLANGLAAHQVETVLDVGANIGQFGAGLRSAGYTGRIISFEPLSEAHARLSAMARNDAKWDLAARCAIGASKGVAEINISKNSVSSSLLPIHEKHVAAAKASEYVGKESVPVIRLDDCELIDMSDKIFLKIDTQGFEQEVMSGAIELLKIVRGIQFELSLTELYEGQGNWLSLLQQADKHGLKLWSLAPAFTDGKTGQVLQADATFFRPANLSSIT